MLREVHGMGAARDALQQFEQAMRPPAHVMEMLNGSAISDYAESFLRPSQKSIAALSEEVLGGMTGTGAASGLAARFAELTGPVSATQQLRELWQSQSSSASRLSTALDQAQEWNSAFTAIGAARQSIDSLLSEFRGIDFSQFEVDDEDEAEAESALQAIDDGAQQQQTPQDTIRQIVSVICAQQNPVVQLILLAIFHKIIDGIISACISAVITPIVTPYVDGMWGKSPQEANKVIQQTARAAVGTLDLLHDHRYVFNTIAVRQNPRARSPQIGSLPRGRVVKLIKKDKDFALILWRDEASGAEIQGWVFARYLHKFN